MFELLSIYGDIISNAILRNDYETAAFYHHLYRTLDKKVRKTKINQLVFLSNFISLN